MKPITLLVIATVLSVAVAAYAEPKYQYLTEAAKAIYDIESRTMKPTPQDTAQIATIACKALERLIRDKEFRDDLYRMADYKSKDAEIHKGMRRDLRTFMDSFLRPESDLLKKAGLSDEQATHILLSAAFFHDALDAKPDPKRILDALDRLRKDTCEVATEKAKIQEDEKQKDMRHKRIKKWSLGIAGALLIALDATAEAPSAGLATASFTLGGAMVGGAVAD